MRRPVCHSRLCYRLTAGLLFAHVLAVVVLAASPRLHRWVCTKADGDDDDCAIVAFIHGGSGTVPEPLAAAALAGPPTWICFVVLPAAGFVPSVFATGGVCEHAPPGFG